MRNVGLPSIPRFTSLAFQKFIHFLPYEITNDIFMINLIDFNELNYISGAGVVRLWLVDFTSFFFLKFRCDLWTATTVNKFSESNFEFIDWIHRQEAIKSGCVAAVPSVNTWINYVSKWGRKDDHDDFFLLTVSPTALQFFIIFISPICVIILLVKSWLDWLSVISVCELIWMWFEFCGFEKKNLIRIFALCRNFSGIFLFDF